MRHYFYLFLACLAMLSCENNDVLDPVCVAIYRFNVENTLQQETKAAFNPKDHSITWQEGDEVRFAIRLYDNEKEETIVMDGGNPKAWEQEKTGKLVYSGSDWKTYEKVDGTFREVEEIRLESKVRDGYVTFRYSYNDPMVFSAVWFRTVDFKDGLQVISVQVPVDNMVKEYSVEIVEDEAPAFDATKYLGAMTQDEQKVADRMRAMDMQMCSRILQGEKGNLVCSPYSLQQVLAMALNATDDEALEEVLDTYGLTSADKDAVNAVLRKQRNKLANVEEDVTMRVANRLWVDYRIPVYRSYQSVLQNYYDADIQALDCQDEAAGRMVNLWVEEQTNGMIQNVMPDGPVNWRSDLMNAIYMNAGWTYSFAEKLTSKMPFANEDGTESMVDMMGQTEYLFMGETTQGRLLRMPLGSRRDLEVDFILPAEGTEAGEMLAHLDEMTSACKEQYVNLLMPRQRVYSKMSLDNYLKDMGLGALLRRNSFNRFGPDGFAPADHIEQDACIEFNEKGTEAAAVTHAWCTSVGEEYVPPVPVPFHLDRPYFFVVRSVSLNTLLFVGRVCQIEG